MLTSLAPARKAIAWAPPVQLGQKAVLNIQPGLTEGYRRLACPCRQDNALGAEELERRFFILDAQADGADHLSVAGDHFDHGQMIFDPNTPLLCLSVRTCF